MLIRDKHIRGRQTAGGFTLAEAVMSVFVATLVFGGIVTGYIQAAQRAQWSGYSLAAQAMAIQQLEQARATKWDTSGNPQDPSSCPNQLIQFNTLTSWSKNATTGEWTGYTNMMLNLPVSGTNIVSATNFVTVRFITIPTTTIQVGMVQVDTVWPFSWSGTTKLFTNTIANYYAPDR